MKNSLVKMVGDTLYVAEWRVAAPGYTIFVGDGVSAFGWEHLRADENTEIVKKWEPKDAYKAEELQFFKPAEDEKLYSKGDTVFLYNRLWVSMHDNNSSKPGDDESWTLASEMAKEWEELKTYNKGDVVIFKNNLWVSTEDKNSDRIGEGAWKNLVNFYPLSDEDKGKISIGKVRS